MFTGLIQHQGTIKQLDPYFGGLVATFSAPEALLKDLEDGDSISVNGVCSTAVAVCDSQFSVDYLEETLKKTSFSEAKLGDTVNLEASATLATKLGGHLVSGHVDEKGRILSFEKNGPWSIITVAYSPQFRPYLIPKGSITIDGISLTLVDISDTGFTCHIIPHTLSHTNLSQKAQGDGVNLEYDMVGKYLYNFFTLSQQGA
jgi:riboflavin synthase